MALRIYHAFGALDVREAASRVRCPTLVLHATGDLRVPFEEGRVLAGLIPGARFQPLESENHLLLENEPALRRALEAIGEFLPRPGAAVFETLTARARGPRASRGPGQRADRGEAGARKTVCNHLRHPRQAGPRRASGPSCGRAGAAWEAAG
jgi:hypothetical protein